MLLSHTQAIQAGYFLLLTHVAKFLDLHYESSDGEYWNILFKNQIFIDPLPCDISSIYSLLYNKTVRAHVTQARDNCEGPEQLADEARPDQVVEPMQGRLVAVQRAWGQLG